MFTVLSFVLWCQKTGLVHLFIKSHDNQFTRPNVLFLCVSGKSKLTIWVFICRFGVRLVQKKKKKNKAGFELWDLQKPPDCVLVHAHVRDSCGHLNDCSSYCGCVLVLRHDRTHRVDALKLCTKCECVFVDLYQPAGFRNHHWGKKRP